MKDQNVILSEVAALTSELHLGFNLSASDKAILDQPHLASKNRIIELEEKLPVTVKNELFQIANSPLYARNRSEKATDFWEITQVLGLENIKAYIFSSALFSMASSNKDISELKKRSLATAGLSMAFSHNILGYDRNFTPKVLLCALVSEFGKIPLFLYLQRHADDPEITEVMTDKFIDIHHGKLGMMMIDMFELPAFLNDLFDKRSLIFFEGAHDLSITTIVRIAKLLVRDSFNHHGRLLITSVVDDKYGVISGSVGTEVQTFFDSLGISQLLNIIPYETSAQAYVRAKKEGLKNS